MDRRAFWYSRLVTSHVLALHSRTPSPPKFPQLSMTGMQSWVLVVKLFINADDALSAKANSCRLEEVTFKRPCQTFSLITFRFSYLRRACERLVKATRLLFVSCPSTWDIELLLTRWVSSFSLNAYTWWPGLRRLVFRLYLRA